MDDLYSSNMRQIHSTMNTTALHGSSEGEDAPPQMDDLSSSNMQPKIPNPGEITTRNYVGEEKRRSRSRRRTCLAPPSPTPAVFGHSPIGIPLIDGNKCDKCGKSIARANSFIATDQKCQCNNR